MRCLEGITISTDVSLSKLWEMVKDRVAWRAAVHGVGHSSSEFSDRTTTKPSGNGCHLWGWVTSPSLPPRELNSNPKPPLQYGNPLEHQAWCEERTRRPRPDAWVQIHLRASDLIL